VVVIRANWRCDPIEAGNDATYVGRIRRHFTDGLESVVVSDSNKGAALNSSDETLNISLAPVAEIISY
jgi:aspartate-semialdehyde dehydrogenase